MMDPADQLRRDNWDKGIRSGVHTELCETRDTPYCESCGSRIRDRRPLEWLRETLFALHLYPGGVFWWKWGGW